MRTLDACTEEVFRRSEIKIKKRQKHKRIFLCCIPLLLSICAVLIGNIPPERSTDGATGGIGGVPERGSASTVLHCFEIKTKETQYVITDTDTIDLILGILETPGMTESQTEQNSENLSPPAQYGDGGLKASGSEQYQLTYRSMDGQTHCYTLTGDLLTYTRDGSTKQLSGDALLTLLQVLEILHDQEELP